MGTKVESYRSDDGVLFTSEEAMMVHEATVLLTKEFPELKVQIPFIMAKHERIAEILYPLHVKRLEIEGSHADKAEGSHAEDHGGCDCAAGLAGNGPPHHTSCPMYRPPCPVPVSAAGQPFPPRPAKPTR